MTNNEAISVLECMAIDMTGALAVMHEQNPMTSVLEQRIEAIDVAQAALNNSWISVKDKLPNPHKQHVLVALSDGTVQFATDWLDWPDGHITFNIPLYERWLNGTHWMPMPEQPKGD